MDPAPFCAANVDWLNLCVLTFHFSICCQGSVHVPCISRGFIYPWDTGCSSYILSRNHEYLLFIHSGSPVYLLFIHSGSPVHLIHCLYCRTSTRQVYLKRLVRHDTKGPIFKQLFRGRIKFLKHYSRNFLIQQQNLKTNHKPLLSVK